MVKKTQKELLPQDGECVISKFMGRDFRKVFYNGEWWFSIVDEIEALTESENPRDYWYQLKKRMEDEEKAELSTICRRLHLEAKDGKQRETDCANIEGMLRIIQSIPSKNAEPFKRWLAKTGFERIQEKQNPELAIKRAVLEYELKGYSKQWIQERVEGIIVRNNLTSEWRSRNITNHGKDALKNKEHAILTNVISQGTFGITTKEHKNIKSLKSGDLRDSMQEIELIFNRLGEYTTLVNTKKDDAQGWYANLEAAKKGGRSAGKAREAYESETGTKVVSAENCLSNLPQDAELIDINEQQIKAIAIAKKPSKD